LRCPLFPFNIVIYLPTSGSEISFSSAIARSNRDGRKKGINMYKGYKTCIYVTWVLAHVGRKYHTLTLSRLFCLPSAGGAIERTGQDQASEYRTRREKPARLHTLPHSHPIFSPPTPDSVGYKNEGGENREEKQRAAIMTNQQQLTVWPCIDSISFFERITESRQDTAVVRYRKKDLKRPKKQRGKETYQQRR
jgi:hypothetical protein